MASLSRRSSTGSYSIQFEDRDRIRQTITLGKIPKRAAQQTLIHVEKLAAAQITGTAPDADTSRWLSGASEKLIAKLAKVGLVQDRQNALLGAWIDFYDASRKADPKIKQSTINASAATFKSLKKYFGAGRPLRSIAKGEAKAWRVKVAEGRAENTVRKWTAAAKKLFNAAIEFGVVDANPFDGLQVTTLEVREREFFITQDAADKVLKACPTLEWRLIFALARYGGLRCPSEVLALRWGDILWDQQRFIVRSPKTEHHDGLGSRVVPLFPELTPLLSEGFDQAEPGAEFVITRTRDSATNLRTQMARIVELAGLQPWPKLFQNLRATRATELADSFPGHVAAAWLGHSVKVAKNYYWQVTDDHFEAAGQSAANALQKLPQGSVNKCSKGGENLAKSHSSALSAEASVGDTRLELVTSAV
ncbi:tyrosine-type recombinase/integrase [Posidoniimonas corsicana]|uniref:tyrosine-type recombinase/integrase n=1 Tax=Posidoniimonas corsicana TaxID=1938618 RepID=UPI0011B730A2